MEHSHNLGKLNDMLGHKTPQITSDAKNEVLRQNTLVSKNDILVK